MSRRVRALPRTRRPSTVLCEVCLGYGWMGLDEGSPRHRGLRREDGTFTCAVCYGLGHVGETWEDVDGKPSTRASNHAESHAGRGGYVPPLPTSPQGRGPGEPQGDVRVAEG